jgi:hypothetical protein
MSQADTSAGVLLGDVASSAAAAPATWGVAMDVPDLRMDVATPV